MLNKSIFAGRITHNLELKKTTSGDSFCRFQLAVERNNSENTDFPEFICYKKVAENICKFCQKGDLVAIASRYQSRINSKNKKVSEFVVHEIYFISSKNSYIEEDYDDIKIPD